MERRLGSEIWGINEVKWRRIMNDTYGNFCVVAPRQSGKTTSLVEKFIDTPDSIFISPSTLMMDYTKRLVGERCEGIKCQYLMARMITNATYSNADRNNFFNIKCVFMDELFSYKTSFDILRMEISKGTRIISAATPEIVLPYGIRNMSMVYFNDYEPQQEDVFKNEGGLFEI